MVRKQRKKSTVEPPPKKPVDPGANDAENGSTEPTGASHRTIVGIGASAGGLEAIIALLRHLPADTGMAFVIVEHLDPTHESQIAAILARETSMRVDEITDGVSVDPNRIYVIPPGKDLALVDGHLRLAAREKSYTAHHPIDHFFHSLATVAGDASIGVVLSGSANDGTVGLQAIKAAGGVTLVQDDTAQHPSMPHSAIAAGCVDLVLPPAEIATELARISRHAPPPGVEPPPPGVEPPAPDELDGELSKILQLVRRASGIDFANYKRNTLSRRIARRMLLYKIPDMSAYLAWLQKDPAEAEALSRDILIGVTSFFRDPEAFEALRTTVFPLLMKDRPPKEPVRMWVVGCATGEEAYSLAIAFTEFLETAGRPAALQLFATDVSETGIEKARSGIYAKALLQAVSPERLNRFFVETDGSYRVARSIREMCVFARQNALADPPFSRVDFVSCRNVLIYLEPPVQQDLMKTLHYALKSPGYLWLGSSETIGTHRELFDVIEPKQKIYSKHDGNARGSPALATAHTTPRSPPIRPERLRELGVGVFDVNREADRLLLARYAPAGVLVNSDFEVLQFRGDTSAYVTPAPGRASLHLLKLLREGLLIGVRGALLRAKREKAPVREEGMRVPSNGGYRDVSVQVVPFHHPEPPRATYFLVLFEEPAANVSARARQVETEMRDAAAREFVREPEAVDRELARLRREVVATREYLESVIEQQEASNDALQSANEEVQSGNEELQSINEELETSKEEIQASHEELATVNDELNRRNGELARSNNDQANLLSSVDVPIVMLTPDLRLRRFTRAAERLLNLIPADVGRSINDIKLNFELPELETTIAHVITRVGVHEQEVKSRQGRWFLFRVLPYKTLEGTIDGAVLMFVDIEVLKRGQEKLLRQSELLEQAHEPILMWELDGAIRYWNRGAEATYGYSKEEAIGKSIHELLQSSVAPGAILQSLQTHGSWAGELTRVPRDGHAVWVESRMNIARAGDGARMVLQTDHPIMERKAHEAALHARAEELTLADRRKNEFLATLAHELRNPLACIHNATQVLRTSGKDDAIKEESQLIFEHQTANMSRMIDDLLDVSRITTGGLHLRKTTVELGSLLRGVVSAVRDMCAPRKRVVQMDLPQAPVYVEGDRLRIEQLVGNLIGNAYKFTRDGGHIAIELRCVRPTETEVWAVVGVRDDGIGLDPVAVDTIFEMFAQVEMHGREGLGIGLTLARTLAQLHGGNIEARSAGLGRGSEFILRLPALPASAKHSDQAPAPAEHAASQRKLRLLVVDDNEDAANTMGAVLRLSGHQVDIAYAGPQALELAHRQPPDVVLLDLKMPGMDGYEVARRLRADPSTRGARLIAVTGNAQPDDIRTTLASGFDVHMKKPVDFEQLTELLTEPLVGERPQIR